MHFRNPLPPIPADQHPKTDEELQREAKLEAYRMRADPTIAIVCAFYFVLLLIPRVAMTSMESRTTVTILDVVFWLILTADIAYRVKLATNRRLRIMRLAMLFLLLLGPLVFFQISESTRDIVRVALITVAGLRAINSVRYFFRLRSILYILSAVLLITVAFGAMMTVVENDDANANIRSLGDGLWWSVSTISTVGYGDKYPVTNSGRMIATALIAFGVAMFSILTATLASAFALRSEGGTADQFDSLHERLDRIERRQAQGVSGRRNRAPKRPPRRTPSPHTGTAVPPDKGAPTA